MKLLAMNRSFLFLFLGRLVTNIGDSIYMVAAMWLVYDLGGSAFYSGLAGFLTMFPRTLQFLTGPFVDRWALKRLLIGTQILQGLLILIIPVAYFMNLLTVGLVLVIMPIVALIEQFAYPAQTKALPALLEKADLVKGNSLFAFAYQGVDLVFNALAGILVALFGGVTLFLVDSVTFAAAALLFGLIRLPKDKEKEVEGEGVAQAKAQRYFTELREGVSIFFDSLLSSFLFASVIANFAIGAVLAVLPAFSDARGGPELYGFFLAALSAGALVGALFASAAGKFKVGHFSILAYGAGALCWLVSAFIPNAPVAVLLFGLAWIPIGATNVIFGAVLQAVVPNRLLGRVNSVSASMGAIAMPFGALAGGYFATVFAVIPVFGLTALGMLFVSFVMLLHPELRKLPEAKQMSAQTFRLPAEDMPAEGMEPIQEPVR